MKSELYYRIILFIIIRRLNCLLLLVVRIRYLDGLRDTVIIIIEDCFVFDTAAHFGGGESFGIRGLRDCIPRFEDLIGTH